jgi:hypothetical protein
VKWISDGRHVFLATFFLPIFLLITLHFWVLPIRLVSAAELRGLSTPERIDQARQQGRISQEMANLYLAYALTNSAELPLEYQSAVPWEGTLILRQLQSYLQGILQDTSTTSLIRAAVSSICSYSDHVLPNNFMSDHFYIEYGTISGGLSINDYITSLETVWIKQINQFNWAAPPVYRLNPSPGNRYSAHITSLSPGLYGFVSSYGDYAGYVGDNPNTPWNEGDAYASCMVLNRDYSNFPGSPQTALDATTAHEFNHAIQYGLGALNGLNVPDPVFIEGGATWMEDETFDDANDNYNYLWPVFSSCMGNYNYSPYAYWITFRGMLEPFGTSIAGGGEDLMQMFWELTSQNQASNLGALNLVFDELGTSLADVYHQYAISVKFNRPCQGQYSSRYCLEEGPDYIAAAGPTNVHGTINSVGGSYSGAIQDNFSLNWIRLPENAGIFDITLHNISTGGALRTSIVCDTGTTLRVDSMEPILSAGDSATLAGFNSSGCNSAVLVITNQSTTADNPSTCISRSYQVLTTRRILPTPIPVSIFYFPFVRH